MFLIEIRPNGDVGWRTQTGPRAGQSDETLDLLDDRIAVLFSTNGSYPGGQNNSFDTRGSDDMVVAEFDLAGQLERVSRFYDTAERTFARGVALLDTDIVVLRNRVNVPGKPFSTVTIDRFTAEAGGGSFVRRFEAAAAVLTAGGSTPSSWQATAASELRLDPGGRDVTRSTGLVVTPAAITE